MTAHAVLTATGHVKLTGTAALSAHAVLTGTGSSGGASLAISSKGTTDVTTASMSVTAFTPTAHALVIVSFQSFLFAAGTTSIADTFGDTGGGTWTAWTGSVLTSVGTFASTFGGWTRLIGTGPGSGTVTVTSSAFTGGEQQMAVDQVVPTGGSITVPQSQVTTASFSATGSVVLGSTPATSSLVFTSAHSGATGLTQAPTTGGFTLLDRVNTGTSLSMATYYINTSGPKTIAWGGLSAAHTNDVDAVEVAI